ncbi:MAG TPA: ligase-associated DNA damage response endonuclease PdeM [Flavisolibacter sp.]|jgi:DNA ligase-associated metallophosphoesterase
MQAPLLHKLRGQNLWLSAQRSVFWEEEKTLIVSDLHFGKTGHFRKAGIPVPQSVYKEDLQRLMDLLHYFKPVKLVVVGDFFHSDANMELDLFRKWRDDSFLPSILLVKGNHDILKETWYKDAGIELVEKEWLQLPFVFSHERCETREDAYLFCGHIHPGVVLEGLGKQTLRFPCFYFSSDHCILPAFSRFTGTYPVQPKKHDRVFALVENKIITLQ